jgi:hypothetical protein
MAALFSTHQILLMGELARAVCSRDRPLRSAQTAATEAFRKICQGKPCQLDEILADQLFTVVERTLRTGKVLAEVTPALTEARLTYSAVPNVDVCLGCSGALRACPAKAKTPYFYALHKPGMHGARHAAPCSAMQRHAYAPCAAPRARTCLALTCRCCCVRCCPLRPPTQGHCSCLSATSAPSCTSWTATRRWTRTSALPAA